MSCFRSVVVWCVSPIQCDECLHTLNLKDRDIPRENMKEASGRSKVTIASAEAGDRLGPTFFSETSKQLQVWLKSWFFFLASRIGRLCNLFYNPPTPWNPVEAALGITPSVFLNNHEGAKGTNFSLGNIFLFEKEKCICYQHKHFKYDQNFRTVLSS